MVDANPLRTKAGQILWHELPEEYRYRDAPTGQELGDLEAFLHGHGHLLDLIRTTTEQSYADAFAEEVDGKNIQPWLLPYLAEMLGTQLTAPDPNQRTAELNNSVGWYKSKGTLSALDSVADIIAGTETVSREGWRHVLTTPRMSMPPFTSPPNTAGTDALTISMQPRGCPDMRKVSRAVRDPDGINPLFLFKASAQKAVYWRHHNPTGVPCFPGAYDDATQRTPDLRDPNGSTNVGPHPRRTVVHVRPPQGVFNEGLQVRRVGNPIGVIDDAAGQGEIKHVTAEDLCAQLGLPITSQLQLNLTKNLVFTEGNYILDGIIIKAHKADANIRVRVNKRATLTLRNCAMKEVSVTGPDIQPDTPQLTLENCIVERVMAPTAFVRMEYVTVVDTFEAARLQASDCIITDLGDTLICSQHTATQSCLRYSAVSFKLTENASQSQGCLTPTNTANGPNFLRLWLRDDPDDDTSSCSLRRPRFGEPGYGVLDLTTVAQILEGAEDQGEMGGYHSRHHAAAIRALRCKLSAFLPVGQEIAISYDPLLAQTPPALVVGET